MATNLARHMASSCAQRQSIKQHIPAACRHIPVMLCTRSLRSSAAASSEALASQVRLHQLLPTVQDNLSSRASSQQQLCTAATASADALPACYCRFTLLLSSAPVCAERTCSQQSLLKRAAACATAPAYSATAVLLLTERLHLA